MKAGEVRFKRTVRKINKAKNLRYVAYGLLALILVVPMTFVSAAASAPVVSPLSAKAGAPTVVTSSLDSLTPQVVSIVQPMATIEVDPTSAYLTAQAAAQAAAAAKAAALQAQQLAAQTVVTVAGPDESTKLALAQQAAATFGIDWHVLVAVWQVESGQQWQTSERSGAGATGPCQFLPSTWRTYAYDGNGDGLKNISSAQDCLFGAAKLLASNGAASGNVTKALLSYNHSMAYVDKVLRIAKAI